MDQNSGGTWGSMGTGLRFHGASGCSVFAILLQPYKSMFSTPSEALN